MDQNEQQEEIKISEGENSTKDNGGKRLGATKSKRLLKWSVSTVLLVVVLFGALCTYANQLDTMFYGVRVGNISIAGMTKEEVIYTLETQHEMYAINELEFVVLDEITEDSLTVSIQTDMVKVDAQKTTERLWEDMYENQSFLGKGFEFIQSMLFGREATIYYQDDELETFLAEQLDGKIGETVQNSTAMIVEDELQLQKGEMGRVADKEEIKEKILLALTDEATQENTPAFTVYVNEQEPAPLDMEVEHERLATEEKDAYQDKETGEFIPEVMGVSFDAKKAQEQYDGLEYGESTSLPVIFTEPEIMLKDVEGFLFKDLLATTTTNIGGTSNRLSNVRLASSYCNGVILEPGEVFSYNETVGRRTTERGFLPAPAYVGGKTVSEVGGGICQVSSTMYSSCFYANMEIVERTNHMYTVGYVLDGLDATIYYGVLDYCFKNNREYPIKIVSEVTDRKLTISIYGNNTDNTRVELKRNRLSTSMYETEYEFDENIPVGTQKVEVTPYSGTVVEVYRWVYQDDELISTKLESVNNYKTRNKLILINPADAELYGLEAPELETPEDSDAENPDTPDSEGVEVDTSAESDADTDGPAEDGTQTEETEQEQEAEDSASDETETSNVDVDQAGNEPAQEQADAIDANAGETQPNGSAEELIEDVTNETETGSDAA